MASAGAIKVKNVYERVAAIDALWTPRIVAELNGQHVKLARIQGEFVWHQHDDADELFLVLKGSLLIELRDQTLTLNEGDVCVIPKSVEHRPVAHEEVHLLLFEPVGTVNTGDAIDDRTVLDPEHC